MLLHLLLNLLIFVIIILKNIFFIITIVKFITLFNCTEEHDGDGIYCQFQVIKNRSFAFKEFNSLINAIV